MHVEAVIADNGNDFVTVSVGAFNKLRHRNAHGLGTPLCGMETKREVQKPRPWQSAKGQSSLLTQRSRTKIKFTVHLAFAEDSETLSVPSLMLAELDDDERGVRSR